METREERLERRRREKAEQVAYKLEQQIALWDPASAPNSTSDPFKTLFVARIVRFLLSTGCPINVLTKGSASKVTYPLSVHLLNTLNISLSCVSCVIFPEL